MNTALETKPMATNLAAANAVVKKAIDEVVGAGREIGVQVAAYKDGRLVVDTWGGIADPATGRLVDGGHRGPSHPRW